ncbi:MAG: TldD/PmbA family protein [Candidatus Thorarchaeota archaeon]|jgi:PmbA protein
MTKNLIPIIDPLLKEAHKLGADEVEIFAQCTDSKDVNIESNSLKTAVSQALEGAGIRILKKKSIGFASVNSLNEKSLKDGVQSAVAIARVTPPMDNYYFSAAKEINEVSNLYDTAVAEMSMDDVISKAEAMLQTAQDVDPRVKVDSGTFSASTSDTAIVTSSGIEASERKSSLTWFLLALAVDGEDIGTFDYELNASVSLKDADPETTGRELGEKVLKYLKAEKTESFEGAAIFSSDALSELIDVVIQSASASKLQAGASYLKDRLGERVFSESLTIIDDGTLENKIGSTSFDREGVPHSTHPIVEKGVFKGVLYDTFTANKDSLESSGHAFGVFRQAPTIQGTNLEIKQGSQSLDSMISEIDHGLFIPRISAFPDSVSGDFAGPVKGGQLIKNGEIVSTLKEITITGNLFEALKDISAISKERKFSAFQGQTALIPNVTLTGMKFAC